MRSTSGHAVRRTKPQGEHAFGDQGLATSPLDENNL